MGNKKAARKGLGCVDQRGPMGVFRARITLCGKLLSKSFATRPAAEAWLKAVCADHGRVDRPAWAIEAKDLTLAGALERRLTHIAGAKNLRNEKYAVARLVADFPDLTARSIFDVDSVDIQHFIRARCRQGVAPATVNRDISILSHTFNLSASTFGCTGLINPIGPTTRLKLPRGRVRRISAEEEAALLNQAAIYEINSSVRIGAIIRFALDTAMRQGEITAMLWENVDLVRGTVYIPDSKNGEARSVPLWMEVRALLRELGPRAAGPVWSAHEAVRSAWRRVRAAAIAHATQQGNTALAEALADLRFHDTRHEGTSRLIEKTGWENAKIQAVTGHKTAAMLTRYTHLRSSDLASQMAAIEGGGRALRLVKTKRSGEVSSEIPPSARKRAAWAAVAENKVLLAALIDVRPIRDVAADFGVSDVAVHKALARLGIAKKPRGHWLKGDCAA